MSLQQALPRRTVAQLQQFARGDDVMSQFFTTPGPHFVNDSLLRRTTATVQRPIGAGSGLN
jgi:hypothetical protein